MSRISNDELRRLVKEYRINYPMTQAEMAEKTGISSRSITRFENGGDISLSAFLKILDALDLSNNVSLLIPDQSKRPSYYLAKEKKRQRATKKSNIVNKDFKWGDEK